MIGMDIRDKAEKILLPSSLQDRPAELATLTRWLLLGLLLRLLFIPFAAHNDYLSEHWRAERVAFSGVVYPTRLEVGSHYLDALNLRLIEPLLPEHGQLFWSPSATVQSNPHAGPVQYARFAAYPRVNRALFLTKVPYLFFDLVSGLILLHLFNDATKSKRAFKYWILNPVMIFAVYIFGRYEVYAAAFGLLSLFLLSRDRRSWGALILGVAVLFRTSMLLLVPIYAMATAKQWSKRFEIGLLGLLPFITTLVVLEGVLGLSPAFVSSRQAGFVTMLLHSIGTLQLYPYVIGYVIILLGLDVWSKRGSALKRFALASLFVFQLILITAWHSIVYYAWAMPFFVWLVGDDKRLAKYFVWQVLAWGLFWFLATDAGVFTPYLFAPLSPLISRLRPTPGVLAVFEGIGLQQSQVISVARSILAAVAVWIISFALYLEVKQQRTLLPDEADHE